ncbi:MAG: hypothetical protein ACC661_05755 [Verrucomicrobiales bacterium]
MIPRSSLLSTAVLAALLLTPGAACGQLAVGIEMDKKTFVSYETMKVEVTVYNRSGRDLVLGGPADTSWLRFQVTDSDDNLLISGKRKISERPALLEAGARITRSADLTEFYPVYGYGNYRLRASVYLPPMERFYESRELKASVSDGKEIWGQVARGPAGGKGAGELRRFSLLTWRGEINTELYVRVADDRSGGVYATFSLGSIILFHEPQATIDREGSLHVLYLAAPQVFAHSVVAFDGSFLKRDIYRAAGYDRPELTTVGGGEVRVRGGVADDPVSSGRPDGGAPAAGPAKMRRLSERPAIPGLPTQAE